MNIECLEAWLKAGVAPVTVLLGPWKDGKGMEAKQFLSVNFDGGAPPGPASRYSILDLWYASPTSYSSKSGGTLLAYKQAKQIEDFFAEVKPDRPFANVKFITGIIGPKEADGGRLVFNMKIEITS